MQPFVRAFRRRSSERSDRKHCKGNSELFHGEVLLEVRTFCAFIYPDTAAASPVRMEPRQVRGRKRTSLCHLALLWNLLPVTLGNLAVGTLLTGVALYATYPAEVGPVVRQPQELATAQEEREASFAAAAGLR